MAGSTPLFNGVVLTLDLCDGFAQGFVTGETERIAGQDEIILVICRMRVMAFHAVPFRDGFVHAQGLCGDYRLMTPVTYRGGGARQQLVVRRSMRIMAPRALLLHRGMDKRLFELIIERRVAFQTEAGICPRLELECLCIVLGKDGNRHEQHNDDAGHYRNLMVKVHNNAPLITFVLCDIHRTIFPQREDGSCP
jgi:hypothetical protein